MWHYNMISNDVCATSSEQILEEYMLINAYMQASEMSNACLNIGL